MAVLVTPQLTTVETAWGDVRVVDTGGAGTPLLLVHALLTDPDFYARLVPLLTARGYRCLVPELPMGSHGVPVRPDADLTPTGLAGLLVAVLDALGVERVDLVGVDSGGALSQLLMAHHRDRVRRVVLTACDAYEAYPPPSVAWLAPVLRSRVGVWVTAQSTRLRPARRLASLRPLTHAGISDDLARRWTAPLLHQEVRRDLRKLARGMHGRYTLAAAELNKDFPRPVLIAWGEDDRVFPRGLAERLAVDLPHARLVTLQDCAAFAAIDQPDRLADLIDEHCGDRAPAGRP